MKVAETKAEAKAEVDLVKELTGEILARAEKLGWTRDALAARAKKKSASTIYGWRNGSRPNPSLLDVQAFAQAVDLTVALIPKEAAKGMANSVQSRPDVGGGLRTETAAVVALMESESTSDELRAAIRDEVNKFVAGRASHPLDADAEHPGPRVRRKT